MTLEQKRCARCHRTYTYQPSGPGCIEETNDATHCPSCMRVILDALSSVPVLYNRAWVVTRDVSVETLVRLREERAAEIRAKGGLPVFESPMPRFNLVDPSNSHRTGVVHLDGRTYCYDYWTKDGMDKGQVCVEVCREAETGKVVGPWRLTDHWKPWPNLLLDEEVGAKPSKPEVEYVPEPLSAYHHPVTRIIEDCSLDRVRPLDDAAFLRDVDEAVKLSPPHRRPPTELGRQARDAARDAMRQTWPGGYLTIEELLGHLYEPDRSACLRLLADNRKLFETVQGSVHNHQAWPGGYLDHVREVGNIAVVLYMALAPRRTMPFLLASAIKVLYLHDVEKPWKYQPREGGGLEEVPELRGDKAAQHAFRERKLAEYGITLTEAEANALRYVEGEMGDYSNRRRVMNELAGFCHACDVLSARLWHDRPLESGDEWPGASR